MALLAFVWRIYILLQFQNGYYNKTGKGYSSAKIILSDQMSTKVAYGIRDISSSVALIVFTFFSKT